MEIVASAGLCLKGESPVRGKDIKSSSQNEKAAKISFLFTLAKEKKRKLICFLFFHREFFCSYPWIEANVPKAVHNVCYTVSNHTGGHAI